MYVVSIILMGVIDTINIIEEYKMHFTTGSVIER